MVLTNTVLEELGFETNHPENLLKKYYMHSSKEDTLEWRIMVEQDYLPLSNTLTYNATLWKCNDKGAIVKRASLSDIKEIEDLNILINLCGIDIIFNFVL